MFMFANIPELHLLKDIEAKAPYLGFPSERSKASQGKWLIPTLGQGRTR